MGELREMGSKKQKEYNKKLINICVGNVPQVPQGHVGHQGGRRRRRPEGVHQEVDTFFGGPCETSSMPIF